jgi:hypothetical protein
VDVQGLMKEANKASFKNYPRCYDLAKKAYDAGGSSQAAYLMGACACKMGDAGKAKRAANKVRGDKKDKLVKLCSGKGVQL